MTRSEIVTPVLELRCAVREIRTLPRPVMRRSVAYDRLSSIRRPDDGHEDRTAGGQPVEIERGEHVGGLSR